MMIETPTDLEAFQKMLENIYEQSVQEDPSQKVKDKAWKRFQEMGLPTRKTEVFQYIRLRTLYTKSFQLSQTAAIDAKQIDSHILPECSQSVLVIVNGYYCPDLSRLSALPKRLVILPLHEASRTYGSFLTNQWAKILKDDNDPFSMLNAALHQNGIFLYAPPKTVLENPIQLLFVTTDNHTPMLITPRIHGFIGSQSELKLVATHTCYSENENLFNLSMDISIDEDSHVQYIQSVCNLSKNSWHFDACRASLKRNSTFKTVMATTGSTSLRQDYRITLLGENAEARLNGVWMLSGNNEAHAHVLMEHQAPNCRSMQLFKGALDDSSRSSFEGKILVRQAAQKTEAFQLNNNLILSDKAIADSKPNLEIFADDVKASHGATVGQLDSEQLFYLRTRGYSEQAARNILVYGFCKEVIDLISIPSVTNDIIAKAQKYLIKES